MLAIVRQRKAAYSAALFLFKIQRKLYIYHIMLIHIIKTLGDVIFSWAIIEGSIA